MASPSFSALGRKFLICTLALWVIILRCSGSSVSRLTRLVGAGARPNEILWTGEAWVTGTWETWDTGALTWELALPVTWPRARNVENGSGWG